MAKSVPSTVVAREFLKLGNNGKSLLTPVHLLKLTYIANGWAYPVMGRKLVYEQVEAWQYGPVYRDLYFLLREFKAGPVEDVYIGPVEMDAIKKKKRSSLRLRLKEIEGELIEFVYDLYGDLSGPQLITLTHREGSPWSQTKQGNKIDQNIIEKYFHKEADRLLEGGDL